MARFWSCSRRFGHSSSSIRNTALRASWRLISRRPGGDPSAYPNLYLIRSTLCFSRISKHSRCSTLEILISSAIPLRICLRQRLQKVEIDDHTVVRVESTDAVLVGLGQVATHLDRDGRVNHPDHRRRQANVRRRAAVQRARRAHNVRDQPAASDQRRLAAHQTHLREEHH